MIKCNVISHRGANRRAPQNTIPAFEHSIKIGVDVNKIHLFDKETEMSLLK